MRVLQLLVCLLAGHTLLCSCTNDYDDLAYVPAERARPGACDDDGDCAGDAVCRGGTCSCLGEGPCSAGETCCAPVGCRDLDSDPQNCGECGEDCQDGLACNAGVCTP